MRGFWHLMLKWKGSVFKLVWHDLLIFLLLYIILGITYRFVFYDYEVYREMFELVCIYSSRSMIFSAFNIFRIKTNC
jgi:hypothetical protein